MSILTALGAQMVRLGSRLYSRALSVYSRVFTVSTPEVYDNIDTKSAIDKGFDANICVYVCAKKDAQKFAVAPRYVYDAKVKEEKKLPKIIEYKAYQQAKPNALTELLNRPNPYQSQDAFFMLLRACYKITGNAYIWLNRGNLEWYRNPDGTFDDRAIDRLPVLEMYVLPPQHVVIIPDETNLWGCVGYLLEAGERVAIRKGDVIHWRDINLNWDAGSRPQLLGMSPLTPGSKTLEESNSLSKAAMRMSQNDGAKAVLFNETMNAMTSEQQTQLKRVIDTKINNTDVAGAVATLQGKWGMHSLAMSSKDQEMIQKKRMSWREIALLMDVPPQLVDIESKFDDLEIGMLQWVTSSIIPACRQLDGEMNRVLLRAFNLEGSAFIGTDYSDYPEVQAMLMKNAKLMQEIWAITPDEVRETLMFEPVGGKFAEPWPVTNRMPLSDSSVDDGTDELLNDIENDRGADQ